MPRTQRKTFGQLRTHHLCIRKCILSIPLFITQSNSIQNKYSMESIEKILQDLHSSVSPIGSTYGNFRFRKTAMLNVINLFRF